VEFEVSKIAATVEQLNWAIKLFLDHRPKCADKPRGNCGSRLTEFIMASSHMRAGQPMTSLHPLWSCRSLASFSSTSP
jgi:hypothetical protein